MKRWTLRILVFLLLGAIVNVAVAWGCASLVRIGLGDAASQTSENIWERSPISSRFPPEMLRSVRQYSGGEGGREALIVFFSFHTGSRSGEEMVVATDTVAYCRIRAGFPARSLTGEVWTVDEIRHYARKDLDGLEVRTGLVHGLRWPDDDVDFFYSGANLLPVRPLWPGFAINTVFYAVVLWLLFAAPFVLRRRRRIRRGLCPKCAYDLRATAGGACPECGFIKAARITRRAASAASPRFS